MSYERVIPRDLFNEASLLKCYGKIYLLLENMPDCGCELFEVFMERREAFRVEQNDCSGGIYIANVKLHVRGRVTHLERPLNSREAWPLWLTFEDDPDADPVEVFDELGNFSSDMISLLRPPVTYRRGFSDYDAIRDTASNPDQMPAIVTEEEYYDMLGCVPPIYVAGVSGFLVGEALTHDQRGTVYANYYKSGDGLFCARYHCVAPRGDA